MSADEVQALRARIVALQTALAQTTNGALHLVAAGTDNTRWYCRYCGATSYGTSTCNHRAGCPVQVLADSYREE